MHFMCLCVCVSSYRGMSTIVVTPPAAAAFVAVQYPSQAVRPGSLTWTWQSTIPGITTLFPTSSTCTVNRAHDYGNCSLQQIAKLQYITLYQITTVKYWLNNSPHTVSSAVTDMMPIQYFFSLKSFFSCGRSRPVIPRFWKWRVSFNCFL